LSSVTVLERTLGTLTEVKQRRSEKELEWLTARKDRQPLPVVSKNEYRLYTQKINSSLGRAFSITDVPIIIANILN
jgi:hypothetical protein